MERDTFAREYPLALGESVEDAAALGIAHETASDFAADLQAEGWIDSDGNADRSYSTSCVVVIDGDGSYIRWTAER